MPWDHVVSLNMLLFSFLMNTSADPIHVDLSRRPSHLFRGSIDSSSSTSSCESLSPRKSTPLCNPSESWPSSAKVPFMRLFMKSPTHETIPPSLSSNNTSYSNSPRQSSADRKVFTQVTVIPDEDSSLRNSITSNSYNITSLSSLRKQKMDRLRKKLGQDVPFDLVFPSSDTESERSMTPNLSADIGKECSVLSSPTLPRRGDSGRISTAHDSISGFTSVHNAQPQSIAKKNMTTPTVFSRSEPKHNTTRLSLIIESPDEHGVGCAQEFGIPPKPEQGAKFQSEWSVNKGETEVKLWSTRKGYEGWRPTNASQTPPTISSFPPPPSLPNVPLKKPSSYRKPVPPLLEW